MPEKEERGFPRLAVEREIAKEMAGTLGRIGRAFVKRRERVLRALAAWEECPDEARARKARLERALHEAMDEAERFRYFLIVQREAMGLRDHEEVARRFPLPGVSGRPPAPGDPASPRLAWPGAFRRGRKKKTS